MKRLGYLGGIFLFVTVGCVNRHPPGDVNQSATKEQIASEWIRKSQPAPGAIFRQGASVTFGYEAVETEVLPDSVVLFVNGVREGPFVAGRYEYTGGSGRLGKIPYKLQVYRDGAVQTKVGDFTVMAAAAPERYTYRVKATYPHARTSFTQGLFWHHGALYEGTGLNGASRLMRVNLATGKSEREKPMEGNYFGEGIALLNGKIYQLTWQDQKGFIYDAATFKRLSTFDYAGEGWGLTTDGTWLYMSDGSHRIYRMDPKTLRRVGTLEVYTRESPLAYLNELEWINGEIWANIYQENLVARIDPQTGAVKGIVDFSGLLAPGDVYEDTDVLNGIAYDPEGRRIFVTGKNWSKLFEVELVKK